jgi:SAM-dependent methyltransferase
MTNVIRIPFEESPALATEMEEFERLKEALFSMAKQINVPSEYVQNFLQSPGGVEVQHYVASLPTPLKILDIGCGRGESSVLLSMQGHQVHAVEPSAAMCEVIDYVSQKFSLPIKTYQGIGETVDLLSESDFDLCLFNASFHHCEKPLNVLKNCFLKLKKGGKILLLNEPILKFYRSKQWYQEALEKFHEQMGHYGGNEHIYYFHEYKELLSQAGFGNCKDYFHQRLNHPSLVIRNDCSKKLSDSKLLFKFFVLVLFKQMIQNPLLSKTIMFALKRLSLVPMAFEATREI